MALRESLTNEKIKSKFKSQFELVDYAIKLVNNMVKSGRAPRVKIDIENPAVLALEEIIQGRDIIEDLPLLTPQETIAYVFQNTKEVETETIKAPEKKKRRLMQ